MRHVDLDDASLRRAFGAFPTGVTVLSAVTDSGATGMTASSFTSVSLSPPLVSVCVAHASATWPVLRLAKRLGISVLGASQVDLCRQLAARDGDRLAGVRRSVSALGAITLPEACAWFECSLEQEITAGDHLIVVLRIHNIGFDRTKEPLVFYASSFRALAQDAVV